MALESDRLLDRRRLKRRLAFWRIVAVAAIVAAVISGFARFAGLGAGDHLARLDIDGIIFDDPPRIEAVRALAENHKAKALIVRIDSPGGTVVGGESLFSALRFVAGKKPVVAVIAELGTSAGYMAALGADRIVARPGSITGSIGVILQTTDVTGMLGKIGVHAEAIKSSPLKAQPSPLEPLSAEGRTATQAVVDDIYAMFIDLVAERRKLPRAGARRLADGRVFTGRQAKANGLIDALGGRKEAVDWLISAHGIAADLPVEPVRIPRDKKFLSGLLDDLFGKTMLSERLRLDGLVSLWHPGVK
jgi:protease-4